MSLRPDESFAIVPRWVVESGLSDKALRLYTMLACFADYSDGTCNPGRKKLAKLMRCSVDTVDRSKAELVEIGAVTVTPGGPTEDGQGQTNQYVIHRVSPSYRDRTDAAEGGRTDAGGGMAAPMRQEREPSILERESSSSKSGKSPTRVGGVKVTKAEHDLIDGVLAAFNSMAKKNFAGAEWRKKIALRIREHPELDLDAHQAIIVRQFEKPWWKGEASPSVVYGNGAVFDRAVNGVQGPDTGEDPFERFRV